ncbi:hypothetical protein [uncultured Dokdonia sp.]|uniref:hypothetical protein n=1 Tax=uncultured Dokdonia sp. TaxID=575653 RepID=UPI00261A6A0A|nr:hypothetical protein [uncultured Dokdonia sp.]
MKKISYYLPFILLVTALAFVSCDDEQLEGEFFSTPDGSDPEVFCQETGPLAIAEAQLALLGLDPSEAQAGCDAFIATINSFINTCGDEGGALQMLLDELGTDCNLVTGGDDDDDGVNIVGRTYLLTTFTTTSELDFNGDGIATTDLLAETGCFQNETIFFNDETNATAMSTSFLNIVVEEDSNGNLVQLSECIDQVENTETGYVRDGNTLNFDDFGEEIPGIISGNQIIFSFTDAFLGEFINDTGDGTVEVSEDLVIIYTAQ